MSNLVMGSIAVVLLSLAGWALDHHGYVRGTTDRDAYYEPILRKAAEAEIAANRRADAAQAAADKINDDLEAEHAHTEQTLLARATSAESRIDTLLRERAASAANRCQQVSAFPIATPGGDGLAPISDSDRRFSQSLSAVGTRCEHDADTLARWQEWYSKQRTSLTSEESTP